MSYVLAVKMVKMVQAYGWAVGNLSENSENDCDCGLAVGFVPPMKIVKMVSACGWDMDYLPLVKMAGIVKMVKCFGHVSWL